MNGTIAKQQAEIEKLKAETIRKGECQERHARSDKDMDEIKGDLRDIKKLLMDRLPPMRGGD